MDIYLIHGPLSPTLGFKEFFLQNNNHQAVKMMELIEN